MKKLLTLLCGIGLFSAASAQTWDFTTSSSFPAGFVTWNKDSLTVNSGYSASAQTLFNSAAWVKFQTSSTTYAAATTSWLSSTSTPADRWLVTPSISVPTGQPNVALVWYGYSYSDQYRETYQVRISTTDSATTSFGPAVLTITEPGDALNIHVLPLAAYAGQNIRVAFRDISVNQLILMFTKMQVMNLPSHDLTVKKVETYEHNWLSQPATLHGYIQNLGLDTVTSFGLNYSVNGGATVSTTVNTVVPALNTTEYSVPYTAPAEGVYSFKVWTNNINGSIADQNPGNDSAKTSDIFFYPQVSGLQKNVLVEEFTGAWCGYCPGGAYAIRDLVAAMPTAIPVAIHDANGGTTSDDAMQITDGKTVSNAFNTGFPSAMVDRVYWLDEQDVAIGFNGYTNTNYNNLSLTYSRLRAAQATPANVSISDKAYDSTTNQLSVTVNATFLNNLSQGDYRLNLYVVEDSVITSGAGYDQENYYANPQVFPAGSSELTTLGSVITNNGTTGHWSQNHVLRAMAGGPWGTPSIIPSAPVAGTTYSNTYNVTLNSAWRNHFTTLVGVVEEYNNNAARRYILNATESKLVDITTSIRETAQLNSLGIYPNPASSVATLAIDLKRNETVEISVVNTLGQVVAEPNTILLNAGAHNVNIPVGNLANGLYTVKVTVQGAVNALPLSIQR